MPLLADPVHGEQNTVYAVDMPGYNFSSKPEKVSDYSPQKLAAIIARLIQALSPMNTVYLVGHDWGGGIAWEVARYYPKLVKKLFIMNCPPVEVLFKGLFRFPRQLLQSYYIFFFQLPWIPERALQYKRCQMIRNMYSHIQRSTGEFLSEDEIESYIRCFNRPKGASGINYYRAALRSLLTGKLTFHPPLVTIFTVVIWGVNDVALNIGLTTMLKNVVTPGKLRLHYIPNATHHVQQNAPEQCAEAILRELD
jgi:pimeloyl-ACP methyl ester carboxylesterase